MIGNLRKKINIITPVFPPYAAGMGNVAFSCAQMLQNLGYEIKVLVPNYSHTKTLYEQYQGISVVRIQSFFKYGNAAFIPRLSTEISDESIVHLHVPFFGGTEIFPFIKKRKKLKIIVHYHMDAIGKGWRFWIFFLHRKFFLKKILACADRIIVTSHDYARHSFMKEYFERNSEKVFEIPLGVDTKIFYPQPKNRVLKDRYRINGQKVLLFVGGLDTAHYFKGLKNLIVAMKNVEAYCFVVGGGGLLEEYKKFAESQGVLEKIIFLGKVSLNELVQWYNLCDAVIAPSTDRSEAFGLVVLEAQACGKPVIASDLPGVRTVVRDEVDGFLVRPNDISDLEQKIKRIVHDSKRAEYMGQNGLKKVLESYTLQKIKEKFSRIIQTL